VVVIWVVAIALCLCPASRAQQGDYFQQFEDILKVARQNAAIRSQIDHKLDEDLLGGEKSGESESRIGGKEIEISCPGIPTVSIKDIVDNNNPHEFMESRESKGDCVVVKMKGVNFAFEMSMNCGDDDKLEFNHQG
jgi:hypothetical protein